MKRIYLHPLAVRIWHWVNALCFIVLILTGVQIRYHVVGWVTFKSAVEAHNLVAFALIANLLFWAAWHVVTGKLRLYLPKLGKPLLHAAIKQARYYAYGMMKGEKNPHHMTPDKKFNTLQQLTYMQIMLVLLPLQCVSGVLLWDPLRFGGVIALVGGLKVVAIVHVVLFIFFTAFLFGHIYLATLGHTPMEHIKAMFTGYEDAHEEEGEDEHLHASEALPAPQAEERKGEEGSPLRIAGVPVESATAMQPRP